MLVVSLCKFFLIFWESVDDLAVNETECSCCVALIGVDVHSKSELGGNANHNVVENNGTSGVKSYLYDLLVGYAENLSISGGHVDVTLCNDNTLVDGNLTAGANQLYAGGVLNVAALVNGGRYAEGACVGIGYLNLIVGTAGAEDAHLERALGAYYLNLFLASELTGLAEILLGVKLSACAEESLKRLLGDVEMTSRGFYEKFLFHNSSLS